MRLDARFAAAFFAIYVIWGSTYLAIRVAVETIPPLATAGLRHLFAGVILFVLARAFQARITATEWRASLIVAALFFLIGHGTLHWAEQTVPSGVAALLVATEPLWIAILMPSQGSSHWSLRMIARPRGRFDWRGVSRPARGVRRRLAQQVWGSSAILLGAMSWALGVRYSATAPLPRDPFVRASTTLLCGAALLLTTSIATGEVGRVDLDAVSGRSLLGLAYLIVFGSVVAFSAYTWLLERCSATLVATHTYVNPVIAVLLGWLFAGEPLTMRIALATGLILAAVLLLKSQSTRQRAEAGEPACGQPVRATASE